MKPSDTVVPPGGASIAIRGRFAVRGRDGADLTPSRRKDRGLLALLAMSPQRRRSRAWLQGLLWSDRAADQAAGSLRRTLCDLRRDLGEASPILDADRFEIWLTEAARIDACDDLVGKAELLEAIEVPDPAFEDWLRDLRAEDGASEAAAGAPAPQARLGTGGASPSRAGGTDGPGSEMHVIICTSKTGSDEASGFFVDCLVDALSERMEAEGAVAIHHGDAADGEMPDPVQTVLRIELSTITENGFWNVHLRALADRNRRFLWSGRLRLPLDARRITGGPDIPAFVSTSLSQMLVRYRASRSTDGSPYLTIQRAAARLFDADRTSLDLAEHDLARLPTGDWTPVVMAWRAFARLTRVIEFGDTDPDIPGEAMEMAGEALRARPGNPLVAALAAQVALKLEGDVDQAHHLAKAAMRTGDQNPYSYDAAAQVDLMRGDRQAAYAAARRGRLMAEGLPHEHSWDMLVCLTALGVEDLPLSLQAARIVHLKAPAYRPALRYLSAINLLIGDVPSARLFASRLRSKEPAFVLSHLKRADYPVQSLQSTGYADALPVVD